MITICCCGVTWCIVGLCFFWLRSWVIMACGLWGDWCWWLLWLCCGFCWFEVGRVYWWFAWFWFFVATYCLCLVYLLLARMDCGVVVFALVCSVELWI